MSKIFINLLFLEGGINLIFLAGWKARALSEWGCLPKLAIFNSCSRAAASFSASKSAFSCSAFNSKASNLPASFNSASLKARACASCASCDALSALRASRASASCASCNAFSASWDLWASAILLIAVLHAQILILTSKLPQFLQLDFLYLIDNVIVDAIVLNQIKNMGFWCTNSWGYSKMDSDFEKVFLFFNLLRGSQLRDSSNSRITSCSTNAMAAYSQVYDFNLVHL